MSYILSNDTEQLNDKELMGMALAFIIAGSGTVGSSIPGTIFHLCRNQDKYRRLVIEVRENFLKDEDITILSTGELRYLKAAIEEGLHV